MGEEEVLANIPPKVEKRTKSKSKTKMHMDENECEQVQSSDREVIDSMTRHHKKDRGKKKNKGTRNTEEVDVEKKGEKKGVGESELIRACDADSDGEAMDDTGRKMKKTEKHKNNNMDRVKKRKREKQNEDDQRCKDNQCVGYRDNGSEATLKSATGDILEAGRTVENENKSEKLLETFRESHHDDSAERAKKKKKKKKIEKNKTAEAHLSLPRRENMPENVDGNMESMNDASIMKKRERKKSKKSGKYKGDSSAALQDTSVQYSVDKESDLLGRHKIPDNKVEHSSKGKQKNTKLVENGSDDITDNELGRSKNQKKKKTKSVESNSNDPTPTKSNKKVRFSGQDEVFSIPAGSNSSRAHDEDDNLVRGKRFTPEEDEMIKEAIFNYIEEHNLGDDGLDMVLNTSKHRELIGCWKEIAASAIPNRPYPSVYGRAQVIFRRSERRKWTQEEYDMVLAHQKLHGNNWKELAEELGKHRSHVKDTWRRIKLENANKGRWSQEEYQKLFDLVNIDLRMKASQEKKSKHGMLRDNICWTAISDTLETRSSPVCNRKWYNQLTSPLVDIKLWNDSDDYRMIDALYNLDATCMEDVDWDDLVEGRSGDICRKRWNEMLMHMGQHRSKSFAEQVEILANRYCPYLLEAREAWENKPRVP